MKDFISTEKLMMKKVLTLKELQTIIASEFVSQVDAVETDNEFPDCRKYRVVYTSPDENGFVYNRYVYLKL